MTTVSINTEIVRPNVKNFIKSLRDMGYTFEIAVADILDNSISAKAKNIQIFTDSETEMILSILDDGTGMSESELVEAMRLGSKNPDESRQKHDLGRFGLGLKTASFSQCKKVTVITKKDGVLSARRWDLDYIEQTDEWHLITPSELELITLPFYTEINKMKHGTIVVWESIDAIKKDNFIADIYNLRDHLSLVFHRFLEGSIRGKKIKITVNNKSLDAFNPFNEKNDATQCMFEQKFTIGKAHITVQPFILPHHNKMSRQEYERYATAEGYTKSQGFYLYREGRLLIYGTWWGLHKVSDAHRLVRIRIDVSNDQDDLWQIDIKKSMANPNYLIKNELKKILNQVLERGSRPYTGRGKKIEDKTTTKFWELMHIDDGIRFSINKEHPLLLQILDMGDEMQKSLLKSYLKGLEAYLPLAAIQSHMMTEPHKIQQDNALNYDEIYDLAQKLKQLNLDEDYINLILKTEMFKNHRGLLLDGE